MDHGEEQGKGCNGLVAKSFSHLNLRGSDYRWVVALAGCVYLDRMAHYSTDGSAEREM